VVERDCRLSCVGMCIFTCNGTRELRSKCCNHESARERSTKLRQFTCETAEPKAPIIIGPSSFALSTRSFSLRGSTLNVHSTCISNTMGVKRLPDAMPFHGSVAAVFSLIFHEGRRLEATRQLNREWISNLQPYPLVSRRACRFR